MATVSVPIGDLVQAAHNQGATTNDVVLVAVRAALSTVLGA